ncbi:hypothetical protein Tco_0586587, partial [Tanacetum coccineum]
SCIPLLILPPYDVDEECGFPSTNILDYTSTLPNYFPATWGNDSSDFSENSKNDEIPPIFSPFYNNLYLKDMQAFYAKESPISPPDPITSPAILTPYPVLPPSLLLISDISLFLRNYYHLRSKSIPHLLPQLRYLIHLGSKPVS